MSLIIKSTGGITRSAEGALFVRTEDARSGWHARQYNFMVP
jgi:hypothetical protein